MDANLHVDQNKNQGRPIAKVSMSLLIIYSTELCQVTGIK